MAVTKTEQTQDEIAQEQRDVKQRQDDVFGKMTDDLDLSLDDEKEEEVKKEKEELKEEVEEVEEEVEEVEEEVQEDEEEDVVPVSKMKKRISAEKAKADVLKAELEEIKAKQAKPSDSRTDRLESMNEAELKSLKANAKAELRQLIRSGDNPDREAQVDELIDDIDRVIRTAPSRFEKAQISNFDKAVRETQAEGEVDVEKDGLEIKEIAQTIYKKYPELQKLKTGQAAAWRMAVDHFKTLSKSSRGKSDKKLKQENNKLKRKVSLDSSSKKQRMDKSSIKKKRGRVKEQSESNRKRSVSR